MSERIADFYYWKGTDDWHWLEIYEVVYLCNMLPKESKSFMQKIAYDYVKQSIKGKMLV